MWTAYLLFVVIVAQTLAFTSRGNTFRTVSRRHLPLSAIHRHLPRPSEKELRHLVFELQDGYLVSHHARLSLRSLVSDKFILLDDETHEHMPPDQTFSSHNSSNSYVLQGHGYTFAFDGVSNNVIGAWGPALRLHPIDPCRYSRFFLNFATRTIQTTKISNGTTVDRVANALEKALRQYSFSKTIATSTKQEVCSRRLKFEIGVAYDRSFCALYGDSETNTRTALIALNFHIKKVFMEAACIDPEIITFDGFCNSIISRPEDDVFAPPSAFSSECSEDTESPDCIRNSRLMLDLSAQEWARTVSSGAQRDAAFLFTGYGDDTSLAGAMYRAAACSDDLSFGWIKGADPVVFAHEIGHMLGSPHDSTGLMTARVRDGEALVLSENSKAFINRFVQKDPRSWCLQRNWDTFGNLQVVYKWDNPLPLFKDEKQNLNVSDLTTVPAFQSNLSPTILFLVSERTDQNQILSFTAFPNITCSDQGSCHASLEDKNRAKRRVAIPLSFEKESFGFGIAFAHVEHESARNLIVSHIRAHNGRRAAYYRIGYNFDDIDSAPQHWSKEHRITKFVPENVQCSSITAAHIGGGPSPDLLHVHVDRRRERNIVQYHIGFNVGSDGTVLGGWSDGIDVEGWYGKSTTAVSVFVKDLDNNGRPELLIYHVDNTPGTKIGSLRVGKDLDSTGHVTGGWTDFIRIPVLSGYPTYRSGAMTIADLGALYPSVVAIQRETTVFEPEETWKLYIGMHVLTPSLLTTAKKLPDLTELQDGCFECYNRDVARQCARDVGLCGTRIDEVIVENGTTSNRPEPNSQKFGEELAAEEMKPNRTLPIRPDAESIYCDGFHYLYSRNQGCDVFDSDTVLTKGVVVAFEKALEEEDPGVGMNISSTSLFEDPAGTFGNNRQPVVATTTITGKTLSYTVVIGLAIGKLRNKHGFSSFIFPRFKTDIIFKDNKYVVKFISPRHIFMNSNREANEVYAPHS